MIIEKNTADTLPNYVGIKINDFFKNSKISEKELCDFDLNFIDLKTGEILFRQGDSAGSIYLILEGKINLIQKQSFGKTNSSLSENNFFGHVEYFLKTERRSIAIALENSRIAELTKTHIEKLLSLDNSILNNFKNSFFELDSKSIKTFEKVITNLNGLVEKPSIVFPMELKKLNKIRFNNGSTNSVSNKTVFNSLAEGKKFSNKTKSSFKNNGFNQNGKLSGHPRTSEVYNRTRSELINLITDLKLNLAVANGRLILSSQLLKKQIKKLEIKESENSELCKKLEDLFQTLDKKNIQVSELNNLVAQLRNGIHEADELKKTLRSHKTELDASSDAYKKLHDENNFLLEQVKSLKLQIEKVNNESTIPATAIVELTSLKLEVEKYKQSIVERDEKLEAQKQQIDNIGLLNSGALKAIAAVKSAYAEKLKAKDNQIAELKEKLGSIQRSLDDKTLSDNQQIQKINNQAPKIEQLESSINESQPVIRTNQVYSNDKNLKADNVIVADEIFSKSKLIKTKHVPSRNGENLEHFKEGDIHLVNVNISRATLDLATGFNEFLQAIICRENKKIIINLVKCEFIDSSFLGVLVTNLKKVTALGGDLRLVGLHPSVKSMLELTRVNRLFECFPDAETAIKSYH
jgi:anti-anti-sigma factor